jgi:hypothetical protein
MMPDIPTIKLEFGCACVDQDPRVCFYIRYHKNPLELTNEDICDCECHEKYDTNDNCDYENEEVSTDKLVTG